MSAETPGAERADRAHEKTEVPEILEWLVAGLIAIAGLGMALGGSALLWVSDGDLIAEAIAAGVADGSIQTGVLTPAEFTAIATSTAFWVGIGLVLTGLGVIALAILYLVGRYRARRSTSPRSDRERLFSNAVIGAVATAILSFVPASPVLGGGIAGYLQRQEAPGVTKAGALSGLLSAVPAIVLTLFVTIGLVLGIADAGLGLGVAAGLMMVIVTIGLLVYFVGLAALGGYLADRLADDERTPRHGVEDRREDESSV